MRISIFLLVACVNVGLADYAQAAVPQGDPGAAPPPVGGPHAAPPGRTAPPPTPGIAISPWEQIAGCAKRIAIAESEHPYVIGCGPSDDTQVFRLATSRVFEPRPGAGVSVIAYASGAYGVVSSNHKLWFGFTGGQPGEDAGHPCVREAGAGGAWTWVLSCIPVPNTPDYPVYRRNGGAQRSDGFPDVSFQLFPGAGVRVGVGITDSVAWLVNSSHEIYRQDYCKGPKPDEEASNLARCGVTSTWQRMPGSAIAVANGGKNQVWVIGTDTDKAGNGGVYQWNGNEWNHRAGSGKDITVDPLGRPWVVAADGTIWRWRADVPAKGTLLPSDPR